MSIDTSLTIQHRADGTIDTGAYIERAHALRAATLRAWLVARLGWRTATATGAGSFGASPASVS
ncbi:MAG: hypothetical protein SF002_01715 [Alphaproteobacteria bacterium]|nr:hypothetical protein [Alphaproteobacteria bacterium]